MQTIKFPILVLVLVARLCRAEVVIASPTPDRRTSLFVKNLVNIVTSCYGDRINGIGLLGDLPDTLHRRLSAQYLIPVVLIDNNPNTIDLSGIPPIKFRYKLPIFIVGASSRAELQFMHNKNGHSIWGNHKASFFILDRSPRCEMAIQLLETTWRLSILNAKVMCYDDVMRGFLVSFNPFGTGIPAQWRKVTTIKRQYMPPTNVFVRRSQGKKICENLDLDILVKNCGGYPIIVSGDRPTNTRYKKYPRYSDGRLTYARIENIIYRALNVTPLYNFKGNYNELNPRPHDLRHSWEDSLATYPFSHGGSAFISQFRGNKSQLNKILSVIDVYSRIGVGIAYLVTLIFFKYFVRQALVPAILNLVRITCGSGFANIPHSNAPRIFLTTVLFLAVTMHGFLDGNLAALLTTVIPVKNINTMKDIVDFDYTIYGPPSMVKLIDLEFRERYIEVKDEQDCIEKVMQEKSSTCLTHPYGYLLDLAQIHNLHIGRTYATMYIVFEIRWHWFLEERLNLVLSKVMEADVLEPWNIKCNPVDLEYFQTEQDVKNNVDYKPIELGELTFAFVILAIGLVLASITFIVELGMQYRYRWPCRVERRTR